MTFSDPGREIPLEADHNACGVDPQKEAELAATGWERRATIAEPRLSEAAEVYRNLGFQVHLEPFDPAVKSEGGCTACFDNPEAADLVRTIYTRRAESGTDKGPS